MTIDQAKRGLIRAIKLRCPACGLGPLFRSLFQMNLSCEYCDLVFTREQGYFVGAIYVNVVATEFIIFCSYVALDFFLRATDVLTYSILFSLAVVLPILFNRYARSIWLGLDYALDPPRTPGRLSHLG